MENNKVEVAKRTRNRKPIFNNVFFIFVYYLFE